MENYFVQPVGLYNLSKEKNDNYYNYKSKKLLNICYMNSSIQCLFHLKKFTDFILNYECKENKNLNLVNATKELLFNMIKNKDNLNVENIKNAMGKIDDRYKYNNQEDANEFISNFLNNLLEETSDKNKFMDKNNNITDKLEKEAYDKFYNKFYKKKGKSLLLNLFYGNLITVKYCKNCGLKSTIKFSAYNMLELPIYELSKNNTYKTSLDIDKILDSYFSDSIIYDEKCEKCKEKEVCKKNYLYSIPNYLIVFFGRTVNDYEYIDDNIIYSNKLNLNKYLYNNKNNEKNIYKISSIIYYSSYGNKKGHYTSLYFDNNKWFYFDDDNFQVFEKLPTNNNENEIIIFYEKKI